MTGLPFAPRLTFVCDVQESMLAWFKDAFPDIHVRIDRCDALCTHTRLRPRPTTRTLSPAPTSMRCTAPYHTTFTRTCVCVRAHVLHNVHRRVRIKQLAHTDAPLTDVDIINSGKHLLGEKPFGIDKVSTVSVPIR